MEREQIERWVQEGTITKEQAKKMLADVVDHSKERSSARFIVAIATIGAVLLGIGATLFIYKQWDVLSNPIKVLLLLGATTGAYGVGYSLRESGRNVPMVGGALILLGALLFGATVALTAQMYQINIGLPVLLFLWFLGTIPTVYTFNSPPVAALDAALLYLCITDLFFGVLSESYRHSGDWYALPVFLIVVGLLLFEFGGLHYLQEGWRGVARSYRLVGVNGVMLALFLLTFRFTLEVYAVENVQGGAIVSSPLTVWLFIGMLAVLIVKLLYLRKAHYRVGLRWEHGVSVVLLAASLLYFFKPPTQTYPGMPLLTSSLASDGPLSLFAYALLFNLLAAMMIVLLLWIGYRREDMPLVNTATVWAFVIIVARYFDLFWDLLGRTTFFIIGGILFLALAIMVEKWRRVLSVQFHQLKARK